MPNKAWPGIVFSHWGRLEVNHTSNTDYGPDDYSKPFVSADMDEDWRDAFKGHACFDPKKVGALGQGTAVGCSVGRQQASSRLQGSARFYQPFMTSTGGQCCFCALPTCCHKGPMPTHLMLSSHNH